MSRTEIYQGLSGGVQLWRCASTALQPPWELADAIQSTKVYPRKYELPVDFTGIHHWTHVCTLFTRRLPRSNALQYFPRALLAAFDHNPGTQTYSGGDIADYSSRDEGVPKPR